MNRFFILTLALGLCLLAFAPARATNCAAYPYTLVNGTPNDANKVMADFNSILACANALANAPVNSNITQITGLTTPLSVGQGGTGTNSLGGFATSGANSNITSLSGLTTPLSVGQGGTGTTSLSGFATSGANSNITSLSGLTTPLSVGQGGTGATNLNALATSGANSNITSLSGLTTPLTAAQGGTGTTTVSAAVVPVLAGLGNGAVGSYALAESMTSYTPGTAYSNPAGLIGTWLCNGAINIGGGFFAYLFLRQS